MKKKMTFIDLRKEIEVIKKRGHFPWISLRSSDLSKKCTKCKTGLFNCTLCFGTGILHFDKLTRGLKTLGQPGIDFLSKLGEINTKIQIYYLEHDVYPKVTDFVLELETNTKNIPIQPFTITRVFKINDVQPMRGTNGRLEFWKCAVEERNYHKATEQL